MPYEFLFNTKKTFDNVFFPEKTALIKKLTFFQNNIEQYHKLGISHTLGLLFYGEPGCGKTSTIKCIANFTKRNIFIIKITKRTTLEDLHNIFNDVTPVKGRGYLIPNYKRMYVFEEIDCGSFAEIINNKDKIKNMSITKNELLEFLDGLIEIPGRLIIFTTNFLNVLDQNFIRSGRIDMHIHFKKMTIKDICKMYLLWFNKELPHNVIISMKENVFSMATVSAIFNHVKKEEEIYYILKTNGINYLQ